MKIDHTAGPWESTLELMTEEKTNLRTELCFGRQLIGIWEKKIKCISQPSIYFHSLLILHGMNDACSQCVMKTQPWMLLVVLVGSTGQILILPTWSTQ